MTRPASIMKPDKMDQAQTSAVAGAEEDLTREAQVPRPALYLGAAGLIPFIGLSIASLLLPDARQGQAMIALAFYGAVILSFLGGIHWGLEMARQATAGGPISFPRLGISVLPSLVAWAALALPGDYVLAGLCAGFIGILAYDLHAARRGTVPSWYAKLRIPLTFVVCLSLLVPGAI